MPIFVHSIYKAALDILSGLAIDCKTCVINAVVESYDATTIRCSFAGCTGIDTPDIGWKQLSSIEFF